jgi:putative acetyltransferase
MKIAEEIQEKPPRPSRLEGLGIRAMRATDAEAVNALANMPGYRYGTLRLPHARLEETRKWVESPTPGNIALVATYEGQIVGNGGINRFQGRRSHAASLGMGVHDDFVGRGVGSALLGEMVQVADDWLDIRRLELTVYTDNEAAIALYRKFGFEVEGRLRQFAFRNGEYVDAYSMARLRV